MTHWAVTADREGERVDVLLAREMEGLTRSAAQRLLEEGRVCCRGQPVQKSYRVTQGEQVEVEVPDPQPLDLIPQNIPLDIVYEDEDVVVVNKPVGLVVHPAPGHPDGTLVNGLLYHFGQRLSGVHGPMRPGIVHRIDRDTSGLLMVAKHDQAHQALAAQLQDHTLARVYEALVWGRFPEDRGRICAPIGRHPTHRKKMAVTAQGREAVTHWSLLRQYANTAHVQCELETGRTHQIRVHMAWLGHPLLGDTVYGRKKPYPGLAGQCLHAKALKFRHPSTGEMVVLECPTPDWFQEVQRKQPRDPLK